MNLPTSKDYKKMCHDMAFILESNMKALSKIDGIISFGIKISKRDWTKVNMYFTINNKFNIEMQANVVRSVILLPGMITENIEFDIEPARLRV